VEASNPWKPLPYCRMCPLFVLLASEALVLTAFGSISGFDPPLLAAHGKLQLHPDVVRLLMGRIFAPVDPYVGLTPRQRDVLLLLVRGFSNKEIDLELFLTEATVKGYVNTLLSNLNVADRTQAALLAVRYGLIANDDLPEA
jgi:DNA-binding CsgD family transcriptional regulator